MLTAKKNIWFIALIVLILLINLIPSGIIATNGEYFTDMLYLGIYDGGAVIGQTYGVDAPALNMHHALIGVFNALPGDAFPVILFTILYGAVLIGALWVLIKRLGNYKLFAAAVLAFVLCNKRYMAYLFTVLPFAGQFTFFVAAMCIILSVGIEKRVTFSKLSTLFVFTLLFSGYDKVSAFVAFGFGYLIIRAVPYCKEKWLKAVAVILGVVVIAMALIFGLTYKGVSYEQNIANSIEYGISVNGEAEASSYGEILSFYIKNPGVFVKNVQSLLNNAFYQTTEMPFSLWNLVKVNFIPTNLWIFIAISVAVIAFAVTQHSKFSFISETAIVLTLMLWVSLQASGVIYGLVNLDKNLLLFNVIFDCLACLLIVGIAYVALNRRKELKDKYGVTQ